MNYDALLLVSFGGPDRAEDVMPFIRRVTAGRDVPEQRLHAVAEHYFAAGGASPVNARCRELLSALAPGAAELGLELYWGNRNWHPLLEDTLAQMRDDGAERALAFVTSAYGGYSSCRQYLDDIAAARAKVGPGAPAVDKLRLFYNHPGWVGPWATSLTLALEAGRARPTVHPAGAMGPATGPTGAIGANVPRAGRQAGAPDVQVLFSAHSIPISMAATSPYVAHVTESARLVAGLAEVADWELVWQSRSGSPASPWLGPDIGQVIAAGTAPTVVVVPIGFVCENMEVVHDLDVEAAGVAQGRGARFLRAAGVSSGPDFVAMVLELAAERLGPGSRPRAMGVEGPWPDHCPEGHCPGGRIAAR